MKSLWPEDNSARSTSDYQKSPFKSLELFLRSFILFRYINGAQNRHLPRYPIINDTRQHIKLHYISSTKNCKLLISALELHRLEWSPSRVTSTAPNSSDMKAFGARLNMPCLVCIAKNIIYFFVVSLEECM